MTVKQMMLAWVPKDCWALDYAADSLKADKEVVLAAVKSEGTALRYAADALKADKECVCEGIRSTELDHPCYAVPTAGVPCLLDILKYDGASTEVVRAATMGVNWRFAFVCQSTDSTPNGDRD